jgi:hypothetical protein
MAKFERTKPHINVGTIGHVNPNGRTSLMSSLSRLRAMAALAAIAGQAGNTTSTQSGWENDSGTSTFVNTNTGPMEDGRNRAERRSKKKHGPHSGSKYKKGRWWE